MDLLDAGRQTLAEYVAGPWSDHLATLAPKTRKVYDHSYAKHIQMRLADVPLRQMRADRVRRFQSDLIRAKVGASAIDKAMRLLGAILGRAEADGLISANPMRKVRRSRPKPAKVRALAPAGVEALCAQPDQRSRSQAPRSHTGSQNAPAAA